MMRSSIKNVLEGLNSALRDSQSEYGCRERVKHVPGHGEHTSAGSEEPQR